MKVAHHLTIHTTCNTDLNLRAFESWIANSLVHLGLILIYSDVIDCVNVVDKCIELEIVQCVCLLNRDVP